MRVLLLKNVTKIGGIQELYLAIYFKKQIVKMRSD